MKREKKAQKLQHQQVERAQEAAIGERQWAMGAQREFLDGKTQIPGEVPRQKTVLNNLDQSNGRNNVQESHHPWGAQNDWWPSSSESTQHCGAPTNAPTWDRASRRSRPVLSTGSNHPSNSHAALAYSQIANPPRFPIYKFAVWRHEISRLVDSYDGVNQGRLLAAIGVASSPLLKGALGDFSESTKANKNTRSVGNSRS